MDVKALMNRLERLGEDRQVIVRIERGDTAVWPEYDVVGAEALGVDPQDGLVLLLLRERPMPEQEPVAI